MHAPPPSEIGRYRVDGVLGRGAMGVIYRAHDPAIDRLVAIKLIATDLLSREDRDSFLRRFRREAQAAAKCAHQNIVAVYDFAMQGDNPFIAMEFVDGISLRQMLDRGTTFSAGQATFLILQVLDALTAAHAVGVIHRDVKPANILVMQGGRVKVADFGISRIESADLTSYESVMGTPGYMSPEQFLGSAVDARSDLFSTTAVLYELLTGKRAFPGQTFAEVRRRITQEAPPQLPTEVVKQAPALAAIIECGLAQAAVDRFPSATTMAGALRAAMSRTTIPSSLPDDKTIHNASADRTPLPGLDRQGDPLRTSTTPAATTGADTRDVVARIELALVRQLGPIARIVSRNARKSVNTIEELVARMSEDVDNAEDRGRFLSDARRIVGSLWGANLPIPQAAGASGAAAPSTGSSASWRVQTSEVERAQRALARYLGPVAGVLARRAAASAGTSGELWEALAKHIDRPEERSRFLAER